MIYEAIYRPWLACARDNPRLELEHVIVERTAEWGSVVVGLDGFCIAVVPVEMETEEPDGFLRASVLRYAQVIADAGGSRAVEMGLGETLVTMADGSTHRRRDEGLTPVAWRDVVAQSLTRVREAGPLGGINLDPRLLSRLCLAIGIDGSDVYGAQLRFAGPEQAVVVAPTEAHLAADLANLQPPFGLLMPMRRVRFAQE